MEKFFGRKPILELLKKRILDLKEGYRQNVALLGRRAIGKTVLMEKVILDLSDDSIIPVYIDLENQDLHDIYEKITGRLLFYYAKQHALPLSQDFQLLRQMVQSQLPATGRCLKKIEAALSHARFRDAFRDLFSLPQIFAKEADVYCVLFLDEFHSLQQLAITGAFQELGKKIMTQNRCLYVMASSLPVVAQRILSEELSLLFGNFEIVPVDVFPPQESRDFLSASLIGVRIKDELRNFLVDFSGGHPLFLSLIARELHSLSRVYQQTEVFQPLLIQAFENLLFQPWGLLNNHFSLRLDHLSNPKGNLLIGRLLLALANGKQKFQEIVDQVGVKPSPIRQKLNYLIEQNIVVKNGSFYYLEDKLFRFWIQHVYQQREKSLDFDLSQRQQQFRQSIEDAIQQHILQAHKDLATRVMELLLCFEDEICYIKGRRYRLPVFQGAIPAQDRKVMEGCLEVLRASTSTGEWFVALKPRAISENDINTVIAESKKSPSRPRKCILISLGDTDENVRLRALQERMWVWNEGELNTLLNIFDKPYIL